MIDQLIAFSIRNKLVIGLFTLALIAWGSYSVTQLPIDAVPDITNNQVQVITLSPSLAATDVERLVSFPVETGMATIDGVTELRSFSRFGLSVVTVVFDDDVDVYWARQQVSERLSQALIPAGIGRPELGPVSTGLGEIYQYIIRPKPGYEKKYSTTDLRTIQDWIVRRQLLGTPGVADVSSFGGFVKHYEVALDPDRLRSMNVTVAEVFQAVEKNNQNTGGSYISRKNNSYFIRTEGLAASLEDIGKTVVRVPAGSVPILVRDVATVGFGHANRYGAMTYNNEGEVVGALVLMLKDANASQVIKRVKERMETIRKSLPEGVVVEPYLDRTKLVEHAIGTVTKNLAEGALIVVFVLVLFLGNFRAGLVVASVIPLAMLFAVSMMNLFGVSGNLMSLGAIDFGLIVDGAVIIVESILHRLHSRENPYHESKRLNSAQMKEQVYEAAVKIRSSAAFGEIIILIVYLPILALVGVEGKMFRPMAQTVSFAILGALILSLTYVPMASALFLSRKTRHKRNISDRMMEFFCRIYTPLIHFALRSKALVVGLAVVLFVVSMVIFSRLGGEFIPTLEEGDFAVETRVMTGSSLDFTVEKMGQAAGVLIRKFPEVIEVVGKIGSAEIPTDPMPIEAADAMIILKDKSEWTSAGSREELEEKMAEALEAIPGVNFSFQQPIQMRFNELMSGAKQDVVVKIFGEDLNLLADYAKKAGKLAAIVPGTADLYVEQATGLPQIVIRYNRDRMAQLGLNVQDVNQVIETAFAGTSAGLVYEQERRFELVVRLSEAYRKDIANVRQLFVATPDGQQVPLEQVAKVDYETGPSQIQRDDAKRRITVAFNVRGRDVESVVEDVQATLEKGLKMAPGYHVTYGGQFENLQAAKTRLSIAVPVALLLIFALLYFTFQSFRQSLIIFTAIPFSAIGGILALWLRGMPFSISAGIGFIALFGVAVLNGIVLIGYFNQLKAEGITDLKERILKGTTVRLRPVLMTAAVASLGFLPMALATSAGAEVQKPLATVVIGGLVSATLLTLLVLPVVYAWVEEHWKTKPKALLGLLILLVISPFAGQAQTGTSVPLNAAQAVQQAQANNASVKASATQLSAAQAGTGAAFDPGKTNLQWIHGQYNSVNWENSFTITQPIHWPGLYRAQHQVVKAQVRSAEQQLEVERNELKRNVRLGYEKALVAAHRVRLLRQQDSLYSGFLKAAEGRYKAGETALLEVANARSEKLRMQNRIALAKADSRMALTELQALLNSKLPVTLADSTVVPLSPAVATDSGALAGNPTERLLQSHVQLNQAGTRLERSRIYPDFTLGYFNQSLTGTQTVKGTERYFPPSYRFQGVQAGISVPIWLRPYSARARVARLQTEAAEHTLQAWQISLGAEFSTARAQVRKYQSSLQFYEQSALPLSRQIISQAHKAHKAGEIGYLEYLQSMDRAFATRYEYLDLLHQHNQAVIHLEYLLGAE